MPRRVEVDVGRRLVLERVGFEQAELLLLRERTQHGPVDEGLVERARPDAVRQRRQVGVPGGQLDVDAGLERQRSGLAAVGGDRVHDLQERDREVVGDDDAVEAPPFAQERRQVLGVRRHRHAVDVVVGVHHRPRTALEDRHLERGQERVRDLPRTGAHRGVVAAGPGAGVADEVLERGVHPRLLQTPHVGRADGADEVGVLADALVDAAPARVPHHVEDRRQPLVDAQLPHRVADRARGVVHELGVERRTPGERRRVRGGLPRGEAGEALLVHERRDAQARLALEPALLGPQPGRPLGGVDRACAVHPRVVPETVPGRLAELVGRLLAGRHLRLHRRDRALLVEPVAHELGQLLLERHLRVQRAHALRHLGHGGYGVYHGPFSFVMTYGCVHGDGTDRRPHRGVTHRRATVGSGGGQPFTAPWRPPTMRRSKSVKNSRAGIIDSDVNASTRAVSTEYCDANAWTPSGSV